MNNKFEIMIEFPETQPIHIYFDSEADMLTFNEIVFPGWMKRKIMYISKLVFDKRNDDARYEGGEKNDKRGIATIMRESHDSNIRT